MLLRPSGDLVPDVRRIAALRANSIGDFVVAIPALAALRAAYPDAQVTYLGTEWHETWLGDRPGPWDVVTTVPPYPGFRGHSGSTDSPELRAFFAEQQAHRYDLALQLHGGGLQSNPFVTRLGARITAGSRDSGVPPLDRCLPYAKHQHEVLRFLEVVGLVGAPPVTLEPTLYVTAADRRESLGVLEPTERPLVAVHPGANDPRRRWPPASFAAVADTLVAAGAEVVLIGTADEAHLTGEVMGRMRETSTDLAGRLSLGGTTALLERCSLLVANDSGPRHIAGAVGTATVAVFWCGNAINVGPLTRRRHRLLLSFRICCPVCGAEQSRDRCEHDVSFVADVDVDDVRREALDLFAAVLG